MSSQDRDSKNQGSRYPRREPERPAEPVRRYPRRQQESQESSAEPVRRYPRREQEQTAQPVRRYPHPESTSSSRPSRRPPQSGQRPPSRPQAAYANPRVNHAVNVSQQSETAVFFKLLAKITFLIIFLFFFIYFSFRLATPYIPYSFEEKISRNFIEHIVPEEKEKYEPARQELQMLAEKLASHMNAPLDMPLHIHISPDPDPNAFATLGGHIVINQGTIDAVSSENALAMVLAHEIAHVKNRDPLTGIGTSALFSLMLAIVTGSDSGFAVIGDLADLSFSRQQESNADKDALIALRSYYGHTQGADEFFSYISTRYGEASPPEFLSSHPDTENRLTVIWQDQTRVSTFTDLEPLSVNLKEIQNQRRQRSRRSR